MCGLDRSWPHSTSMKTLLALLAANGTVESAVWSCGKGIVDRDLPFERALPDLLLRFIVEQEQYGLERLCQVVGRSGDQPSDAIKQAVIDDVTHFIGEQEVYDDLTLVVMKQQ